MSSLHLPQQMLLLIIEKIINNALALNINHNNALRDLAGKTLTIKLSELNFPITLTANDTQLLVTSIDGESDCQLFANIAALQELQRHQQLTELIKQDKLDIQGDLKVAQRYASLFENISIDWRTELAKHIGDVPTYKIEQFSLWLSAKFKFAAEQIQADASEWLVHEKQLAVTSDQIEDFSTQVNQLSQRLQQLESQMNQLEKTLSTDPALAAANNKGQTVE
ncbi:SCP2 sterol-binding domain-containing protein [Thalassotalea sp. G2M2-11]|uniref:ubiquinone biosynthesis accessory factor UbiJ n=1 Tax=Thalassotalea sp. G2M2-11 TaxID=2787627 RepID=UPI0019D00F36|nr:SCP2 sterol-binding domain-containing protein [Thalassotalea sp. G2M2-11]